MAAPQTPTEKHTLIARVSGNVAEIMINMFNIRAADLDGSAVGWRIYGEAYDVVGVQKPSKAAADYNAAQMYLANLDVGEAIAYAIRSIAREIMCGDRSLSSVPDALEREVADAILLFEAEDHQRDE